MSNPLMKIWIVELHHKFSLNGFKINLEKVLNVFSRYEDAEKYFDNIVLSGTVYLSEMSNGNFHLRKGLKQKENK